MPLISDEDILRLDENNQETLILKIPITNGKKTKFAYFKPPKFLNYYDFVNDLTILQLYVLEKHKIIEDLQDNKYEEIKQPFLTLLKLFETEKAQIYQLLKKYLHFKSGKKSASLKWIFRNANILQIQKIISYILLLPESVKKNEMFLNQKLNIIQHSQTLKELSQKSVRGGVHSLKPQY